MRLVELRVDGNIIFRMDLREIVCDDTGWMHLAQDRNQWRAVFNTVMNHKILWISWLAVSGTYSVPNIRMNAEDMDKGPVNYLITLLR
jgi:hypothetical protein